MKQTKKLKRICIQCGKTFFTWASCVQSGGGKLCSRKCKDLFHRVATVSVFCRYCGTEFFANPKHKRKFCSKGCEMKNRIGKKLPIEHRQHISNALSDRKLTEEHKKKISETRKGKKLSPETCKKMSLSHKGKIPWIKNKKHSPEARKKMSEASRGRNHWNWKGGKSFEPYSIDWTETLRRSIRERDKYTCQICGKPQGDVALDVHHIDYDKRNCSPENLITLCVNCHIKTNYNRSAWERYFLTEMCRTVDLGSKDLRVYKQK